MQCLFRLLFPSIHSLKVIVSCWQLLPMLVLCSVPISPSLTTLFTCNLNSLYCGNYIEYFRLFPRFLYIWKILLTSQVSPHPNISFLITMLVFHTSQPSWPLTETGQASFTSSHLLNYKIVSYSQILTQYSVFIICGRYSRFFFLYILQIKFQTTTSLSFSSMNHIFNFLISHRSPLGHVYQLYAFVQLLHL